MLVSQDLQLLLHTAAEFTVGAQLVPWPDSVFRYQSYAFRFAIVFRVGDAASVGLLVDARADCMLQATNGATALHWAAQKGSFDVVEHLVRAGVWMLASCQVQCRAQCKVNPT